MRANLRIVLIAVLLLMGERLSPCLVKANALPAGVIEVSGSTAIVPRAECQAVVLREELELGYQGTFRPGEDNLFASQSNTGACILFARPALRLGG